MQFETFLTQMQKMFNIFEKEGEPMEEEAKIRFLFKKVQNNDLQNLSKLLKRNRLLLLLVLSPTLQLLTILVQQYLNSPNIFRGIVTYLKSLGKTRRIQLFTMLTDLSRLEKFQVGLN